MVLVLQHIAGLAALVEADVLARRTRSTHLVAADHAEGHYQFVAGVGHHWADRVVTTGHFALEMQPDVAARAHFDEAVQLHCRHGLGLVKTAGFGTHQTGRLA